MYGDRRPEPVLTEADVCRPDSHYGAAKAAAEAFVQSFGLGEGWGATALRATGVYGITWPPEQSKWFELVRTVLAGGHWPGKRGGTEVHGEDLARAVWTLLTSPGIEGRIFNCSDLWVTEREVAQRAQAVTGCTGPLPDEPAPPHLRVLDASALAALGVRFGGRALFERTVDHLVELARRWTP